MSNIDKTSSGVQIKDTHLKDGVTSGKGLKDKTKIDIHTSSSSSINALSLFRLITLIAIAFITIRILFSGSNQIFNFQSFLEQLQSMPQISTSFKSFFQSFTITTDWGWFNFFRDFINTFVDINAILCWLAGALIDVVLFISAFLKMLFV